MLPALAPLTTRMRRARLLVLRRRRLLAALALGLATWLGVQAATAPSSPTTEVWTLARDLPAGAELSAADLATTDFLAGSVPPDAVADPAPLLGRPLAHAVSRGQPLAEAMVLGQAWVAAQGGDTVVPVRISDPAVVGLLRTGDRVDLLATTVDGSAVTSSADVLVRGARVAAVPREPDHAQADALPGRLVLLAVPASSTAEVTSAAARRFLSVAWNR